MSKAILRTLNKLSRAIDDAREIRQVREFASREVLEHLDNARDEIQSAKCAVLRYQH